MGWYDTVKVSEPSIRGADYSSVIAANNSATDKFSKALEGIGNIFSEPERMKREAMKEYNAGVEKGFATTDSLIDKQAKRQTSDAIGEYNSKVAAIKASGIPLNEQIKQIQSLEVGDKNSLVDFEKLTDKKNITDNELNSRLMAEQKFEEDKRHALATEKIAQQTLNETIAARNEAKKKDEISSAGQYASLTSGENLSNTKRTEETGKIVPTDDAMKIINEKANTLGNQAVNGNSDLQKKINSVSVLNDTIGDGKSIVTDEKSFQNSRLNSDELASIKNEINKTKQDLKNNQTSYNDNTATGTDLPDVSEQDKAMYKKDFEDNNALLSNKLKILQHKYDVGSGLKTYNQAVKDSDDIINKTIGGESGVATKAMNSSQSIFKDAYAKEKNSLINAGGYETKKEVVEKDINYTPSEIGSKVAQSTFEQLKKQYPGENENVLKGIAAKYGSDAKDKAVAAATLKQKDINDKIELKLKYTDGNNKLEVEKYKAELDMLKEKRKQLTDSKGTDKFESDDKAVIELDDKIDEVFKRMMSVGIKKD